MFTFKGKRPNSQSIWFSGDKTNKSKRAQKKLVTIFIRGHLSRACSSQMRVCCQGWTILFILCYHLTKFSSVFAKKYSLYIIPNYETEVLKCWAIKRNLISEKTISSRDLCNNCYVIRPFNRIMWSLSADGVCRFVMEVQNFIFLFIALFSCNNQYKYTPLK